MLLSILKSSIDRPPTVQQATEWWWCQLAAGRRWSQWTGAMPMKNNVLNVFGAFILTFFDIKSSNKPLLTFVTHKNLKWASLKPSPYTLLCFFFSRCMKAPSYCWVPVCPAMAVCQRRRAWRSLSKTWRKWSGFWHSIRFNMQLVRNPTKSLKSLATL